MLNKGLQAFKWCNFLRVISLCYTQVSNQLLSRQSSDQDYRLQTTDYRPQTTDYKTQTTGYWLQTTGYRLNCHAISEDSH